MGLWAANNIARLAGGMIASRHTAETCKFTGHGIAIYIRDELTPIVVYTPHNPSKWVTKILFTWRSLLSKPSAMKVRLTTLPAMVVHKLTYNTEMVENMKNVASADQELSVEERNLLSVAYKNVIGARRASWRIVTSIEQKEESKGNEQQVTLIKEYRQKIEAELGKICEDILDVLDKHLIPSAQSGESKVFYHKMCVQCPRREAANTVLTHIA